MRGRAEGFRGLLAAAVAGLALHCHGPAFAQGGAGAKVGTSDAVPPERVERVTCVLMLRGGASGPYSGASVVDLGTLSAVLTSTALVDPAAAKALGLGPGEWPRVVQIELSPVGRQSLKLSVTVTVNSKAPKSDRPAKALLNELVERTKAAVGQMAPVNRREVEERFAAITRRREELKARVEDLRKRLTVAESYTGSRTLLTTPGAVPLGRPQIEAQLAAKRPRLRALKETLPRTRSEPGDLDDAIRKLIAAREQVVAALEGVVEKGTGDRLELLRARADLAEAQVRLAEGGRGLMRSPARSFRDEMATLEIEIGVLEAQLKELPPARGEDATPAEDPQRLRIELSRAESELNNAESSYQRAGREVEQLGPPPTLVVVDGQEG